jgi:hypothetical protein
MTTAMMTGTTAAMEIRQERRPKAGAALQIFLAALAAVLLVSGCRRSGTANNPPDSESPSTGAASSPSPQTDFERTLQFVRNGQFAHVWVFSRKDGKPLDKDDSDFLRKQAPQVVDWAATDDKRKVIAGTNFDLEQGNMEALKKRFVVEDYTGK